MARSYSVDDSFTIVFGGHERTICPECYAHEHEQGEPSEVYDCKNTFTDENGQNIGQCCCYSKEHGVRED